MKAKDLRKLYLGSAIGTSAVTVALAGLALYELHIFLGSYFQTDPYLYDRYLLAVILITRLWQMPASLVDVRPHHDAWLTLGPALLLLLAAQTVLPSVSLAQYAFLAAAVGATHLAWGPRARSYCLPLLGGAAFMVYPPHFVFGPAAEGLRFLTFEAASGLSHGLYPDVSFAGYVVRLGALHVDFVAACGGYSYLMTLGALSLLFSAGRTTDARLLRRTLEALVVGFSINVARIVTIVGLGRAGFQNLAFVTGHAMLGNAFMLIGIVAVLLRSPVLVPTPDDDSLSVPSLGLDLCPIK